MASLAGAQCVNLRAWHVKLTNFRGLMGIVF